MTKEKKNHFSSGADVLQSLFEKGNSPLSEQFVRWKLWSRWSEYVGASLADQCEPVGYFRGTLWIWVKNSTWLQQLVFLKNDMRTNINQRLQLNYVLEIRFTTNRREVPQSENAQFTKGMIRKFG